MVGPGGPAVDKALFGLDASSFVVCVEDIFFSSYMWIRSFSAQFLFTDSFESSEGFQLKAVCIPASK